MDTQIIHQYIAQKIIEVGNKVFTWKKDVPLLLTKILPYLLQQ